MKNLLASTFLLLPTYFLAQELTETPSEETYQEVIPSFSSTRVINGHSVETLSKGTYEFRIEHRFGDIAGVNGGIQNMFGFDNLSDMRIALEYGITDQLMVGFGRAKGTGAPYRSLVDGFVKYKAVGQEENKSPISITAVAGSSFTYMTASPDEGLVTHFPKVAHRLNYFAQVNVAHHFGDRGAIQISPTLVHRNYVANTDQNDLFALGVAGRLRLTSRFALVGEYYYCFNDPQFRQSGFTNSGAIALEWFTFGHNFTINITNSGGIGETQFIPFNTEQWQKGQFRLGFTVGRKFVIE
ncbi:MAG: hypothetical protein FJ349_07095 [Sphingomonadales bacterium]|nr:hypothetical protein [Sphingomonadales bacterium]